MEKYLCKMKYAATQGAVLSLLITGLRASVNSQNLCSRETAIIHLPNPCGTPIDSSRPGPADSEEIPAALKELPLWWGSTEGMLLQQGSGLGSAGGAAGEQTQVFLGRVFPAALGKAMYIYFYLPSGLIIIKHRKSLENNVMNACIPIAEIWRSLHFESFAVSAPTNTLFPGTHLEIIADLVTSHP